MATSVDSIALERSTWRSAYLRFCDWSYNQAKRWLVPDLRNSQYAYADALRTALGGTGRWLDLGCGHGFVPDWVDERERRWNLARWIVVGVDLDLSSLRRHQDLQMRVYGNIERLPFADASFSLVTANMVLEHVERPDLLFAELRRVLAPGGSLVVHTPNRRGYTTQLARLIPDGLISKAAEVLLGRRAEDVYPTYYRINSERDLTEIAHRNALQLERVAHVLSSPQSIRIPPLMLIEMLWLRLLNSSPGANLRPCIIASFRSAAVAGAGGETDALEASR